MAASSQSIVKLNASGPGPKLKLGPPLQKHMTSPPAIYKHKMNCSSKPPVSVFKYKSDVWHKLFKKHPHVSQLDVEQTSSSQARPSMTKSLRGTSSMPIGVKRQ